MNNGGRKELKWRGGAVYQEGGAVYQDSTDEQVVQEVETRSSGS